jgi:hypothetical protein
MLCELVLFIAAVKLKLSEEQRDIASRDWENLKTVIVKKDCGRQK